MSHASSIQLIKNVIKFIDFDELHVISPCASFIIIKMQIYLLFFKRAFFLFTHTFKSDNNLIVSLQSDIFVPNFEEARAMKFITKSVIETLEVKRHSDKFTSKNVIKGT